MLERTDSSEEFDARRANYEAQTSKFRAREGAWLFAGAVACTALVSFLIPLLNGAVSGLRIAGVCVSFVLLMGCVYASHRYSRKLQLILCDVLNGRL